MRPIADSVDREPYLLEHGSITNVEAAEMRILRLSERLREFQAAGLDIEGAWLLATHSRPTIYRHTLVNAPKPKPKMVPMTIMRRYKVHVPEGRPDALCAS